MKTLRPGHQYELDNFENKDKPGQILQFIEKVPIAQGSTELRTVNDGTTNEELLAVLIDETSLAITKCDEALMWLERRTAERKKRAVEGTGAA